MTNITGALRVILGVLAAVLVILMPTQKPVGWVTTIVLLIILAAASQIYETTTG